MHEAIFPGITEGAYQDTTGLFRIRMRQFIISQINSYMRDPLFGLVQSGIGGCR